MDSSVDSVVHSVVVVAVDSADVAVDSSVGDVAVSLLAVELLADELLAVELAASVNAESKFGSRRGSRELSRGQRDFWKSLKYRTRRKPRGTTDRRWEVLPPQ